MLFKIQIHKLLQACRLIFPRLQVTEASASESQDSGSRQAKRKIGKIFKEWYKFTWCFCLISIIWEKVLMNFFRLMCISKHWWSLWHQKRNSCGNPHCSDESVSLSMCGPVTPELISGAITGRWSGSAACCELAAIHRSQLSCAVKSNQRNIAKISLPFIISEFLQHFPVSSVDCAWHWYFSIQNSQKVIACYFFPERL